MTRVTISSVAAPSPGDIRSYRDGVTIELHQSARERRDWESLLCAFPNAIARGVDIVWKG